MSERKIQRKVKDFFTFYFFFNTAALEVSEHQSILISCLVSINVALPGTQGTAVVCQNQLIFFHRMLQAPQNVVQELAHI